MQPIEQALHDLRELHRQLTQAPAPQFGPESFLPFPPGVDPVAFALEEVSHIKQALQNAPTAAAQPGWVPRASVFADESSLQFLVELPGVNKEDVSVTVADGELRVRGQRKLLASGERMQPLLVENPDGTFERRFPVPAWCDGRNVSARYNQGVLEIHLRREDDSSSGFQVRIT